MGNDEIEVFMSHEAVSKNMGIMWYPLPMVDHNFD
jgi:hypothetical protein